MIKNKKYLVFLAIICGGLFLKLTWLVVIKNRLILDIDDQITAIIRAQPSTQLHQVMWMISWLSSPMMIFIYSIIVMAILYQLRGLIPVVWVGVIMLSGEFLVTLLKNTIQKPRPIGHGSIGGFSFPSGHTFGVALFGLVVMGIMMLEFKNSRQILINSLLVVWIILIMISRVYLRAHFPTDTIGSVLLAVTWTSIGLMIYPTLKLKWLKKFNIED